MSKQQIKKFMCGFLLDPCKKCGCTCSECKHCENHEFCRHKDDKIKLKANWKEIRRRGYYIWKSIYMLNGGK